ncbi:MAG: hypothetical protein CM15mP42_05450 [Methanobacteriota archaeon]|nr:MAG: hypothetical protein CM15mP42_05450 [Euryarchaeota archaeon]
MLGKNNDIRKKIKKIANRPGLSPLSVYRQGIFGFWNCNLTEIRGLNALNIAGVSTFASPLDINGDIDVDGHTNLDNLSVAGVSTFTGAVNTTNVVVGDFLDVGSNIKLGNAGVITATSFSGDGSALTGLSADKIFENNTKVEVVDSGTGYITAEVDGTEALRIKENGYFGLGTNSPVQDLHIRRDNAALRIETPSGSTLQISSGGAGAFFGTISNHNLAFMISNSEKMSLTTAGHLIPGNDSQHDLGLTGTRWRNLYADTLYGDGANLTNLPAGAPVGGASTNTVFFENDKEVAVNYQITSTKNAMTAGPVAINAGIAVTVPSGCAWTIV